MKTNVLLISMLALGLSGCGLNTTEPTSSEASPSITTTQGESVSELQATDFKEGSGAEAKTGDSVAVHYVGTLTDGTEFDSSRKRGETFSFTLGEGRVIEGWDKGVVGMKEGGVRKLVIPPSMAYGERGVPGAIPPNATLEFEVELVKVNP